MTKKQYILWHEAAQIYQNNYKGFWKTKSSAILDLNKKQLHVRFDNYGVLYYKPKYLGYDGVGFFLQER